MNYANYMYMYTCKPNCKHKVNIINYNKALWKESQKK